MADISPHSFGEMCSYPLLQKSCGQVRTLYKSLICPLSYNIPARQSSFSGLMLYGRLQPVFPYNICQKRLPRCDSLFYIWFPSCSALFL